MPVMRLGLGVDFVHGIGIVCCLAYLRALQFDESSASSSGFVAMVVTLSLGYSAVTGVYVAVVYFLQTKFMSMFRGGKNKEDENAAQVEEGHPTALSFMENPLRNMNTHTKRVSDTQSTVARLKLNLVVQREHRDALRDKLKSD